MKIVPLSFLLIVTGFSALLVPAIALQYSYSALTATASVVGGLILLGASGFLWLYGGRAGHQGSFTARSATAGIALGFLWVIEIGINNIVAPPLPARDIVDNLFWAAIAFLIFAWAGRCAYQARRLRTGIEAGIWSGFASGALACGMALAMIVFGMRFITHDPLNIAEWAAYPATGAAPTMAAYFAYETFAGAFLHLVVLGGLMGALLGVLGGAVGKGLALAARRLRRDGPTLAERRIV